LAEFDLIQRYFTQLTASREDTRLGIGDDCALLSVPAGYELATSTDTLVAGVHFFNDVAADSLGHKSLAVNLSDLAAMGADAAWVTLALTLDRTDPAWLQGFCRGFAALAAEFNVQLVGGDTTQGPLSICITAFGLVPVGQALKRSAAKVGDLVCVTGQLGDAALALRALQGEPRAEPFLRELRHRLERPQPRLAAGQALRGLAHAAIDLSDGLISDLGHILKQSGVGATLQLAELPLSPQLRRYCQSDDSFALPLAGGDDYELCVTLPPAKFAEAQHAISDLTIIGQIDAKSGMRLQRQDGSLLEQPLSGYEHFL
jgi:thiamine-monophosphate kinase